MLLRVGLMEWLVILFLIAQAILLATTPSERGPFPYLLVVLSTFAVFLAGTWVYRNYLDGRPVPRFFFRLLIISGVVVPYAFFQKTIPMINPEEVDAGLRAVDLWLFGGDAAVWLERFATPFSCAWFGISYVGYYLVGILFLCGMLLFCRRTMVFTEFGVLILGCLTVALIPYNFFPALGPYHHIPDQFVGPLPEYGVVPFVHAVIQNGPLRDVFPSLHTGIPLAVFLFSARHYRWVALACGLWVPHIVISTMFLRYHYLIDVIAGALLAVLWFAAARPLVRGYQRLRHRHGVNAEP
jgi:membrane-associated phospholipid phosphatase